jgi:hypothetical protein
MWTEYKSFDKKNPSAGLLGANPFSGIDDEDELSWELQSNSRIGASVKAGDIGGGFEYGTGVNLRKLFGTWNFGAGTFLVGQTYTPLAYFISSQCGLGGGDCGLIFWGTVYAGRHPMLQLSMGGFKVALIDPNTSGLFDEGGAATSVTQVPTGTAAPTGGVLVGTDGVSDFYVVAATAPDFDVVDVDQTLPKIEASYTFNLGPAALFIGGGYNTFDVEGVEAGTTTIRDESIDSWVVTAATKMGFGPFYINGQVSYAQNPGTYSLTQDNLLKSPAYDFASNNWADADSLFWALVLGFKVSDMVKLEGGVGNVMNELDDPSAGTANQEHSVWTYYLQAAISPVKNVFIIPEVGYVDYGDLETDGAPDVDQGDATYFAAKFQINF